MKSVDRRRWSRGRRALAATALAVVALTATACGGSDDASAPAKRAATAERVSLCVVNRTSGLLQGTGRTSADPEFRAEPGERACAEAAPGGDTLQFSVQSSSGPSWPLQLEVGSFVGKRTYTVAVCGRAWKNMEVTRDVDCGGNRYRATNTLTEDGTAKTITGEITFADR